MIARRLVKVFQATFNNMGFAINKIDCIGQKFIDFSATTNGWVLDIGAAFGLVTLAALEKGAFPNRQDSAENLRHQLCPNCGYPTSTDGLCAFCRLFKVK